MLRISMIRLWWFASRILLWGKRLQRHVFEITSGNMEKVRITESYWGTGGLVFWTLSVVRGMTDYLSLSLSHTHTHTHAVYNSHQLILSRSLVTFASYWKRLLQWRVLTSKDGCGEGGGYILHCKHFTLSTSGITDGAEGEDSDPNRELTSNKFCRPVGTMSWRCMEERRYGSTHSPRLY